ncbi:hypothetical protein WMF47_07800 [Sorangium sp. So ce861]
MKARDEDHDIVHQTKEQAIRKAADEHPACLAVQDLVRHGRFDGRLHRGADLSKELLSEAVALSLIPGVCLRDIRRGSGPNEIRPH